MFPPTYKFVKDSDNYSIQGSDARTPGWTDRILYKTKNNNL